MPTLAKIEAAYDSAQNFPDLARKLMKIGITSYTVDTGTQTALYRDQHGRTIIKYTRHVKTKIADNFNADAVSQAIYEHMMENSDYAGFIRDIAAAGVRFYEVTLTGDNKRCTYIGSNTCHVEEIPL